MGPYLIVYQHKKLKKNHHNSMKECKLTPTNFMVNPGDIQNLNVKKLNRYDYECYIHAQAHSGYAPKYAKLMVLLNRYLSNSYQTGLFEIDNVSILNIINLETL